MFRVLLLLLASSLLAACATPMRLGISEAEWNNYGPEERQRIKSGYYEVLKSSVNDSENVVPDGSTLHVKLYGGQIALPPFANLCNYLPVEFDIMSGDCQKIELQESNGDNKVSMKICYRNKTLYLDPSRYDPSKKIGSIQLHYSPIWDRGFTYQNVSSTGYVHLTNVNVAVRRYESNEPVDSAN